MKPQSFFIDSTDGKLKWIPNIPIKPKAMYNGVDMVFAERQYDHYLELAKKEAVEINEPYIYQVLMHSYFPHYIDYSKTPKDNFNMYANRGQIYTINMEEEIEVVESVCGCSGPSSPECSESDPCKKKVARIIPKKAEESEDELTQYINHLQSQSFEGWTGDAQSGYVTACKSILEKHFEIKRKA